MDKDDDIVQFRLIIIVDGDILNIIAIPSKEISYLFRKFDPVKRMVISRDSGMLNDYFSITKGQLIDLYNFCNLNGSECDTEELWADSKTGKHIITKRPKKIYIPEEKNLWIPE